MSEKKGAQVYPNSTRDIQFETLGASTPRHPRNEHILEIIDSQQTLKNAFHVMQQTPLYTISLEVW